MNEKSWLNETKRLTGSANLQIGSSHPGETNSIIEPYDQRNHSWSIEQLHHSNPLTWHQETLNPSGYQITPTTPDSLLELFNETNGTKQALAPGCADRIPDPNCTKVAQA